MEVLKKQMLSHFGNTYQVDLMPREQVERKVDEIDFENVVKKTYQECPRMPGAFCTAYLNCESGEVFYFPAVGNTGIVKDAHLLALYTLKHQDITEIPDSDILGDDEMPESEDVRDLENYDERVIECLLWYADDQFNSDYIEEQLNTMYT